MFHYAKQQWQLGKLIYGDHSWREKRRIFLFTARSYKNKSQLEEMHSFFENYDAYPNLLQDQEGLWEVVNRVFFYKDSTAQERVDATVTHFKLMAEHFSKDAIYHMYRPKEAGIVLWESETLHLQSTLQFIAGQRKEGLLTLLLEYEGHGLYHVNFRLGLDATGETCIWIGTIQGYKESLERAKKITKKMHGYRPKNFIFFLMRQLASLLGIQKIYVVSDKGFYTNTHLVRFNRHKLVTFNTFWNELGGTLCDEDDRFFIIPIEEERKTYETAKTHKRNMYRKRYEFLDTCIEEIRHEGEQFLRMS